MTALVKVVTPHEYTSWLSQQYKLINEQNDQVAQIRQYLVTQGILTKTGTF
jgi:hypothetical protein